MNYFVHKFYIFKLKSQNFNVRYAKQKHQEKKIKKKIFRAFIQISFRNII